MGLFEHLIKDGFSVHVHCSLPGYFLFYSLFNALQLLSPPERLINKCSNVVKKINQKLFGYRLLTFCFLLGKKIEPAMCMGAFGVINNLLNLLMLVNCSS